VTIVRVTSAQVRAAKTMIRRAEEKGDTVSHAVQKIANAQPASRGGTVTNPDRKPKRTSEKRLAEQPEMTLEALSLDPAYIQRKLAAKKATIRALEEKCRRLELTLKKGGTWQDYLDLEAERAWARQDIWRLRKTP
jgi:predicted RNase H-like nuclease (RuvC/YqgF family)